MRYLSGRLRGNFTVEASVLLPVITFIMIGVLYYICCIHDRALAQSYTLRAAEGALAEQQFEGLKTAPATDEGTLQDAVIMSEVSEPAVSGKSFSLLAIYRSIKSYRSASAGSSSGLQIAVLQTAAFTGTKWDSSCNISVTTVDYPADWFKYRIVQKRK